MDNNRLVFIEVRYNKITMKLLGRNTITKLPKKITFLKLCDPGLFTGYCFRKTAVTLPPDIGGDILQLKRLIWAEN